MSFFLRKARRAAISIGIGAATSYFLDPQLGRQRRAEMKDRLTGLIGAMREERAATAGSDHGDGDPTGGGMPFEPLPTDVGAPEPTPAAWDPRDVAPPVHTPRSDWDMSPVAGVPSDRS